MNWILSGKVRFGPIFCITMTAVSLMVIILACLPFVYYVNPKSRPVTESEFKNAAELIGDPVTEIRLVERTDIDDRFLVNIRDQYPNIQKLEITSVNITDQGLTNLAALHDLRELTIYRTGVTDNGLCNIKSLSRVQRLDISSNNITDKGLNFIRAPNKT